MTFSEMNWLDRILFLKRLKSESGIEKTVTGNPIHVIDALAAKIKSLTVEMSPIQDLHGQDSPYPAGAGKNLIVPLDRTFTNNGVPCVCSASSETVSLKGTATGSGGRTAKMTKDIALPAGTYTVSATVISGTRQAIYVLNRSADNTYLVGLNGTVTLAEETEVYVGANVSVGKIYDEVACLQIESGSTATAWSPYSNICPISGWSSVGVTRTGKNLLDMDNVPKSTLNCYNTRGEAQNRIGCVIELPPGTYTVTAYPRVNENAFIYMNVVSEGNQFVDFYYLATSTGNNFSRTVTLTSGQKIYIFDQQADAPGATTKFNLRYFQIEIGSTATSYEPYNGQSVTIQLGQTVYGGNAEIISGSGESGFMRYVLTGDEVWLGSKNEYRYTDIPALLNVVASPPNIRVPTTGKCEFAQALSYDDVYAGHGTGFAIVNQMTNVTGRLAISKSLYDIIDSLTGKAFVLPLKSPTALTLDPATMSTLKGDNNVWSDGDNMTMIYKAKKP